MIPLKLLTKSIFLNLSKLSRQVYFTQTLRYHSIQINWQSIELFYSKPFSHLKCKYSVRKTISQRLIKRNPRKSSLDRLKVIFTRMKFMEIKNVVNVYETPASKIRKYLCLKREREREN